MELIKQNLVISITGISWLISIIISLLMKAVFVAAIISFFGGIGATIVVFSVIFVSIYTEEAKA